MERECAELKRLAKDDVKDEHIVASAAGREGDSLKKDDIEHRDDAISLAVEACDPLRKGDEELCGDVNGCLSKTNGSVDSQDSNISTPVEVLSQSVEKTEKQETVDDADVAVVEPSESKGECMEEEFDSGDENVAAMDHFGSGSNDVGLEHESGLAAVRN